MLLLSEGQKGEACEPSKKAMFFRKAGSTGYRSSFTFLFLVFKAVRSSFSGLDAEQPILLKRRYDIIQA
jgi:hypothetical protein